MKIYPKKIAEINELEKVLFPSSREVTGLIGRLEGELFFFIAENI